MAVSLSVSSQCNMLDAYFFWIFAEPALTSKVGHISIPLQVWLHASYC